MRAESTIKMKKHISGSQVTAARALLGLSKVELADACDIGLRTLDRFEDGVGKPHRNNLKTIIAELEKRGIEFKNGNGIGVWLDFKKAEDYAKQLNPLSSGPRLGSD